MLTFLYIAARSGFVVDKYEDSAVGKMEKNGSGALWISSITLRPKIAFGGEKTPTLQDEAKLHHAAHEQCFIANSIKTEVTIERDGTE